MGGLGKTKTLFTVVISEIKLFLTNEVEAAGFASQQQHQFISENLLGIPVINNSSFRSLVLHSQRCFISCACAGNGKIRSCHSANCSSWDFSPRATVGVNITSWMRSFQSSLLLFLFFFLSSLSSSVFLFLFFSFICLFFFIIILAVIKRS